VVGPEQDLFGYVDGTGSFDAGAQEDGDEFAVGKAFFAQGNHLFARTVFFFPLGDGYVVGLGGVVVVAHFGDFFCKVTGFFGKMLVVSIKFLIFACSKCVITN